jgi:DNA-binding NarL/FixJ family response regulator
VASTSNDALRLAAELQPDVTLVDVNLGPERGVDLARQLVASTSGTRRQPVILISADKESDLIDLIDASPAIGFVSKSDLSGRAIADLVSKGR